MESEKNQKGPAMSKKGAYAAISYMASAVLLIMFNKAALSSYNFQSANVITLFQMTLSCALLYAMKCWKIISFTVEPHSTSNNPVTLVPLKTLVHTLPLAMSYLLYMDFISVGIIILGAFIAGARDFSFDAYDYAVVFVANISTAIYLASIAHIGKLSGLSTFGLMWCNGIICGPVLLFWTSIRGDLTGLMNFPHLFSPGFQNTVPEHLQKTRATQSSWFSIYIIHETVSKAILQLCTRIRVTKTELAIEMRRTDSF